MPDPDAERAEREAATRRAAQDAAGELSRMGIDPSALGLATPTSPGAYPASGSGSRPGSGSGSDNGGGSAGGYRAPDLPTARGVARPPGAPVSAPPDHGAAVAGPPVSGVPAVSAPPYLGQPHPFSGPPGPGAGGYPPPGGTGLSQPSIGGLPPTPFPGAVPPSSADTGVLPVVSGPPSGAQPGRGTTYGSALSRSLEGSAPGASVPAAMPTASDLLDRITRPTRSHPTMPSGWRRLVRSASFGLVVPGAAEALERERVLVARVRARQREPRMLAFIAGKGGVGTTTTGIGVALSLAALRGDPTLLIDARCGAASLGRRVANRPAPNVVDAIGTDDPAIERARPLALHSGLHLLDGTPWHVPVPGERLVPLLDELRDDYPFTLIDVGNDTGTAAVGSLSRADQTIVVTTASHDAVESTRVALARVHQVDPHRVANAVIALVCLTRAAHRRVTRRLHSDLGIETGRIVPVPFDPALAHGDGVDPSRLRAATREAYLTLAAMVADPNRKYDRLQAIRR